MKSTVQVWGRATVPSIDVWWYSYTEVVDYSGSCEIHAYIKLRNTTPDVVRRERVWRILDYQATGGRNAIIAEELQHRARNISQPFGVV